MIRRTLAAAVLACLLLVPSHAFAAAPVATGDLDVQSWPGAEAGQSVVIISLTLPDATPLPATVRIPVPEGVKLDWVGEITGADPSQDPTRTYTFADGEGGQYVEYEVSTSRVAQIEGSGPALSIDGAETSFSLRFTQTAPSDIVSFSVRLPAGVEPVSMSPEAIAEPDRNDAGESLYTLPPLEMSPGDVQDITVVYAVATGSDSQSGSTAPIVVILAAGIVVAIIVLMYSIRRQSVAASVVPDELPDTAESEQEEAPEPDAEDDEPFPLD